MFVLFNIILFNLALQGKVILPNKLFKPNVLCDGIKRCLFSFLRTDKC